MCKEAYAGVYKWSHIETMVNQVDLNDEKKLLLVKRTHLNSNVFSHICFFSSISKANLVSRVFCVYFYCQHLTVSHPTCFDSFWLNVKQTQKQMNKCCKKNVCYKRLEMHSSIFILYTQTWVHALSGVNNEVMQQNFVFATEQRTKMKICKSKKA